MRTVARDFWFDYAPYLHCNKGGTAACIHFLECNTPRHLYSACYEYVKNVQFAILKIITLLHFYLLVCNKVYNMKEEETNIQP